MRIVAALALLFALTGCSRNFFHATGQVGTDGPSPTLEGPAFGSWASTPQGCSRDPIDAQPDSRTATIASFFWKNPAIDNIMLRDHRMAHTPDAPDEINLLRDPAGGYDVRIKTVKTGGWLLRPQDCTRMDIDTHEQGPAFAGGRSSLGGTVHFSCSAKQSHVWGDFTFSRCEY